MVALWWKLELIKEVSDCMTSDHEINRCIIVDNQYNNEAMTAKFVVGSI
jgi:hypothetical protein